MEMRRTWYGKPILKKKDSSDTMIRWVSIVFVLITLYTVFGRIEYRWESFSGDIALKMLKNFFRYDLVEGVQAMKMAISLFKTLALSFVTTILGFIIGIVMGLFSARNISNPMLSNIIRGIASFIRAVPTIVWVLFFVSGFGLTSTTAVLGMLFHTVAFFTKAFSECFEEVDKETINALRATGANWTQVVFGSIFPSSLTKMISWLAIRYETNFSVAVIIGPAAGVPGTIGTAINAASRSGDYPVQGFGVMLVFVTALIMELLINGVRQKSIVNEI
ncbi:phosphonate transport system permease protein [Dethiosulfatibacter aminovorans DSM 17477]|uniref:Phosphonate transport system permease protein n=1 Tax=Dethiosulfatibacter aminovorans DSM 17477 TaxID=1121476 RepID=A0A1M6AZC5_9FIRM|nr:ABC transporter permease subunit [Dethiosulfatibacter aminovorans]SHI41835.1 phosphonate transport system permease protein [Dethiosulfatibacter aminovorans DSM 17477]